MWISICQEWCEPGCRSVKISRNWIQSSCSAPALHILDKDSLFAQLEEASFGATWQKFDWETSRVPGCCSVLLFQLIYRVINPENYVFVLFLFSRSKYPKIIVFCYIKRITGAGVACTSTLFFRFTMPMKRCACLSHYKLSSIPKTWTRA